MVKRNKLRGGFDITSLSASLTEATSGFGEKATGFTEDLKKKASVWTTDLGGKFNALTGSTPTQPIQSTQTLPSTQPLMQSSTSTSTQLAPVAIGGKKSRKLSKKSRKKSRKPRKKSRKKSRKLGKKSRK